MRFLLEIVVNDSADLMLSLFLIEDKFSHVYWMKLLMLKGMFRVIKVWR